MGTKTVWRQFPGSLKIGGNGCVIDKKIFDDEFIINVKSHDAKLDIQYGKRSRSVTSCIHDMYSSVLHTKGTLGMTARNLKDSSIKDIDLNVMKVINQDPNAYRNDGEELLQAEQPVESIEQQEQRSRGRTKQEEQVVYTDELATDAVDIVEKYENEVRRQTDFMKNSVGNISARDSINQALFKMIE